MNTLEREIKLAFADAAAARSAVLGAGATPLRARRLQDDVLLDTADGELRGRRSVLRVRAEAGEVRLTFKGPPEPSATMKVREEIESTVADGAAVRRILEALGYRPWFRYQKYREEFARGDVIVAVDETPIGTFVELEGGEGGIAATAAALGRSSADYLSESYHALFVRERRRRGLPLGDMVFERS